MMGVTSTTTYLRLEQIQAAINSISFATAVGLSAAWLGIAAAEWTFGEGPFASEKPDASVISLTLTGALSVTPTPGIVGNAGLTFGSNWDLLFLGDSDPWLFSAPLVGIGSAGVLATLEAGPVWNVSTPDEYGEWFHMLSGSMIIPFTNAQSQSFLNGPFYNMGAWGVAATLFYAPSAGGAYGFSAGIGVGGAARTWIPGATTGGASYSSQFSYYTKQTQLSFFGTGPGDIPFPPRSSKAFDYVQYLNEHGTNILRGLYSKLVTE